MKKFLISMMVFVILVLPLTLNAQATTPEEVVMAMIEAESAGDIEAQVALFADDAVYSGLPPPPDMPDPIVGKEAIRARRAGIAAVNAESVTEITGVNGNTVTTLSRYSDDDLRGMGLDFIEGTEGYVIQDGKITAYTWTMTEESLAELMAVMPPPALPESGGAAFPPYALALILGGLAILGGLGLALRHRRSFR
ncbi:MAG: nuclear transport factor 2 family protein [Gammaproteobacteria bacterium]|nr:nuclear transport factor 2 family protein [Gammaproteobacteria bacterium]